MPPSWLSWPQDSRRAHPYPRDAHGRHDRGHPAPVRDAGTGAGMAGSIAYSDDVHMDEADYLSRLCLADRDLVAGARRLGPGSGREVLLDEALAWPKELEGHLSQSTEAELLRIQYVTERFYARQLRSAVNGLHQDELLALAYLRVVRLQFLRGEPDMGFTKRQLDFVMAAIRQYRAAENHAPDVLEIGCGAGSLLESLAESGLRSIAGIDLAPSAVELSRKRLAPYGLAENVRRTTVQHLIHTGYQENFDLVLLCDVIEHVPPTRVESFLSDIRKLLRDGGRLIAVTPNAFSGPHDVSRHFTSRGAEPEGLHLREYSLRELTGLLAKTGFSNFKGLRLRNCLPWPGQPGLSALSVRIRLRMERVFPYFPHCLIGSAIDKLYFSAVCGQALPEPGQAGHGGRPLTSCSARSNSC
jgi:2-polyprenyl-3-methyl-5-hydroxy-6-metoxy-1,4-benzoquinol methylase